MMMMSANNNDNNNDNTTTAVRRYRSALALNNIAVHLLEERQHLQEAAQALHEGLQLLQSPLPCTARPGDDEGEAALQRAMQHLRINQPQDPKQMKRRNKNKNVLQLEVLTVTPDGSLTNADDSGSTTSPCSCLDSILQMAPCGDVAFCIRIEDNLLAEYQPFHLFSTPEGSSLVQQQVAMLSHNLGVALFFVAMAMPHKASTTNNNSSSPLKRRRQRLLQRSLRHSLAAYGVFAAPAVAAPETLLRQPQGDDANNSILGRLAPILPCLIIALLNSLISILHELAQHEEARQFYGLLVEFRELAFGMERQRNASSQMPTKVTTLVHPAAAAA